MWDILSSVAVEYRKPGLGMIWFMGGDVAEV